jgi:hypothetical protein
MSSSEILRRAATEGNGGRSARDLDDAALRASVDRAQAETNRMMEASGQKAAVVDHVTQLTLERGRTHGDFKEVAAVEQSMKRAMRASPHWNQLPDMVRCALEMLAHKQARIISGRWDFREHWDDIEGYSRCVSRELP